MSSILKNNAYHVLGLDTSASQKDIIKRSKEIINLLKIEELPNYDNDLFLFDDFRTEKSVQEAIRKLQSPRERIKEYFFWFQFADDIDDQAFKLMKDKDYLNVIGVWKNAISEKGVKHYFYQKNIAVLYYYMLTKKYNSAYLKDSLSIWKDLIESDKFWTAFYKIYNLLGEQTTSQELLNDFKNNIVSYLADVYTELYDIHKNKEFIYKFHNIFNVKGSKLVKSVLAPIYQSINDDIEKLERINISKDGVFNNKNASKIKLLINNIQNELNKLIDIGIYDDSQSKTIRDKAANALKAIVLDINNLGDTERAISLLNVALQIVGTSSMEAKIKNEIEELKEIKINNDLIKPIDNLIACKKFETAFRCITEDRIKHKDNHRLQAIYDIQSKLCITEISIENFNIARSRLDYRQETSAKRLFEEVHQLIYNNLQLFNFNKKVIDDILKEIETNLEKVNRANIDQLDQYRNSFVSLAKDKFEGQFEEAIFVLLIDSKIWSGLTDYFIKLKSKTQAIKLLNFFGWLTLFLYGLGIIFFIAAWIYKNKD